MRIAYPQGANWAQLMMPDDETKPIMAIQAMDRGRAVTALEAVRELQTTYGPPPPTPSPAAVRVDARTRPGRWAGWRSSTGRRPRPGIAICKAKQARKAAKGSR